MNKAATFSLPESVLKLLDQVARVAGTQLAPILYEYFCFKHWRL